MLSAAGHFPGLPRKSAGEDQLPVSRNAGRFDEQDVASDRRPGQAGRDARHARAHRHLAFELRRAENARKIVGGDADGPALSFGNADGCMPQDFSDFALEVPYPSFPSIVLNYFPERLVPDLDLARFPAIRLLLARTR